MAHIDHATALVRRPRSWLPFFIINIQEAAAHETFQEGYSEIKHKGQNIA
jgi:hypothetical protein